MESTFYFTRKYTILISLIAIGLAYYTVHVAQEKIKNPKYKAACDFTERYSCSPVFVSE